MTAGSTRGMTRLIANRIAARKDKSLQIGFSKWLKSELEYSTESSPATWAAPALSGFIQQLQTSDGLQKIFQGGPEMFFFLEPEGIFFGDDIAKNPTGITEDL